MEVNYGCVVHRPSYIRVVYPRVSSVLANLGVILGWQGGYTIGTGVRFGLCLWAPFVHTRNIDIQGDGKLGATARLDLLGQDRREW